MNNGGRIVYWWTPEGIVRRRQGKSTASMTRLRAERRAAGLTNEGHPRSPKRILDDVDMVAVALAIEGNRVELNQGEKRTLVALTLDRPVRAVADMLACSASNVDRLRKLVKETP